MDSTAQLLDREVCMHAGIFVDQMGSAALAHSADELLGGDFVDIAPEEAVGLGEDGALGGHGMKSTAVDI